MAYGSRFCDLFGGVELLPRHAATQKLKLAHQASASMTLARLFFRQQSSSFGVSSPETERETQKLS